LYRTLRNTGGNGEPTWKGWSLAGCLRKQCGTGLGKERIWSSVKMWLSSRGLNFDSTEDIRQFDER